MTIERDDLLWLAGWLEGEGSFGCYLSGPEPYRSNTIVIQAVTTDQDVAEKVARIYERNVIDSSHKKRPSHHKASFGIRLHGMPAVRLMLQLYPFMSVRRKEQIKEALSKYKNFINALEVFDG